MTKFTIRGVADVEIIPAGTGIDIEAVSIRLEIGKGLEKAAYVKGDGIPNATGSIALTMAFIQGLIANLKHSAEQGFETEEHHFEYIKKELERTFEYSKTVKSKGEVNFMPENIQEDEDAATRNLN